MNKLQTTIAQGRRRQLGHPRVYKLQPSDISVKLDASTGGLTVIMPEIPNNLDKMRDVTPKNIMIDNETLDKN